MSSNLSVVNFTVGGSLTVSGICTLSSVLNSSSNMDIQGLKTTSLEVTGISTFNNLPTSSQTPISDTQLTTKIYVDSGDAILDERITSTDADQRIYIDNEIITVNTSITNTDNDRKSYIDDADGVLNTRITDTDASQRIYIDQQITSVNEQKPLFYVHQTSNNTQTIPNNTMKLVSFSTVLYNVLSEYRIGDNVFTGAGYGGYYQFNASVCLPNITSGYIAFFKDNVEFSRGSSFSSSTTNPETTLTGSTMIYLNGLFTSGGNEVTLKVICSPSTVISGSISKTFFTGHFIQL
jgi:hypothetical protein